MKYYLVLASWETVFYEDLESYLFCGDENKLFSIAGKV